MNGAGGGSQRGMRPRDRQRPYRGVHEDADDEQVILVPGSLLRRNGFGRGARVSQSGSQAGRQPGDTSCASKKGLGPRNPSSSRPSPFRLTPTHLHELEVAKVEGPHGWDEAHGWWPRGVQASPQLLHLRRRPQDAGRVWSCGGRSGSARACPRKVGDLSRTKHSLQRGSHYRGGSRAAPAAAVVVEVVLMLVLRG